MPTRSSRTSRLSIPTRDRCELVEITGQVRAAVRKAEVRGGVVYVYVPHTTAGVCINENADPDVKHDVLRKLETLIPKHETYYRHAEGNSDSHLKAILTGNTITLLVEDGDLLLGQWQGIYLCEFDGPRQRDVIVSCVDHRRPPLD